MTKTATIPYGEFSQKHKDYVEAAGKARMAVAEGAIRSGKTIDHCILAARYLELSPDKFHLASGPTMGNAKLNIGVCNGFGLENLFRGRCKWGKYRENEVLFVRTQTGEKIIIFAGGSKADSYKKILGNSYGLWIATEINEHFDSPDSRISFIKVASGRQTAAKQPYTLWDLNPCAPSHNIYEWYIDKYKNNPNYVYEHFNIFDNATINEERRLEIAGRYDPESVWYRRDILGERAVAEGVIYRIFADNQEPFLIDADGWIKEHPLATSTIGVDFGGNKSGHAFECTGFEKGLKSLATLAEWYYKGEVTPKKLEDAFVEFASMCVKKYGTRIAYCDNAEPTLIQGLRSAVVRAKIPIEVAKAKKSEINGRIRFLCMMMSAGRYHIDRKCKNTRDALASAVWDDKKLEDVRLDDGTTNIDSLDAMEYSYEPFMEAMTYAGGIA